jgi:hypothetical protein
VNLLDPVRECADAHRRAQQEDPGYPGITTNRPADYCIQNLTR